MYNSYKTANIIMYDEIFLRAQLLCIEHSLVIKLSVRKKPNFITFCDQCKTVAALVRKFRRTKQNNICCFIRVIDTSSLQTSEKLVVFYINICCFIEKIVNLNMAAILNNDFRDYVTMGVFGVRS